MWSYGAYIVADLGRVARGLCQIEDLADPAGVRLSKEGAHLANGASQGRGDALQKSSHIWMRGYEASGGGGIFETPTHKPPSGQSWP